MSGYGHGGPGEANFWARMAKTQEGQAVKAANNARRTAAAAQAKNKNKNKNKSSKTYHGSFGKHYGGSRSRKTRRSTRRGNRR